MAKVGVRLKLNVQQIDKARLFRGAKGVYLDCTAFIDLDEADQYGQNGMITQDVTKEERESGTRGPILGNCKVFYRDGVEDESSGQSQQSSGQGAENTGGYDDFNDDIPFAPMHQMMGG